MRLWNFLINRWRITYGVGLGFFIFYAVMLLIVEPSAETDSIIYTPIIVREYMGLFILVQGVFLVLGTAFRIGSRGNEWDIGIMMIIVPLIISAILASSIAQPAIGDQRLFHQSSVRVKAHVYNLARYHPWQLAAYECDTLGIRCQVIYRGGAITSLEYCESPPHWEIEEDTVSLIVRCETAFTHRVPD